MDPCLNSSELLVHFTIPCGTLNDTIANVPYLGIGMQWKNLESIAGYLIIQIFLFTFNFMLFSNEKMFTVISLNHKARSSVNVLNIYHLVPSKMIFLVQLFLPIFKYSRAYQ